MKKTILWLMFMLIGGICFGQYSVQVIPLDKQYNADADADALTQFLEDTIAQYNHIQLIGPATEPDQSQNVKYVVSGLLQLYGLDLWIIDVDTRQQLVKSDSILFINNVDRKQKKAENEIKKFVRANLGSMNKMAKLQKISTQQQAAQAIYDEGVQRDQIARSEVTPEIETWKNRRTYMSIGLGPGVTAWSSGGVRRYKDRWFWR
jgi:hypothetical protein